MLPPRPSFLLLSHSQRDRQPLTTVYSPAEGQNSSARPSPGPALDSRRPPPSPTLPRASAESGQGAERQPGRGAPLRGVAGRGDGQQSVAVGWEGDTGAALGGESFHSRPQTDLGLFAVKQREQPGFELNQQGPTKLPEGTEEEAGLGGSSRAPDSPPPTSVGASLRSRTRETF